MMMMIFQILRPRKKVDVAQSSRVPTLLGTLLHCIAEMHIEFETWLLLGSKRNLCFLLLYFPNFSLCVAKMKP